MARPDLIRSWTSDAVGLFDPGYVWHQYARIWQRPVIGEASLLLYRLESPPRRASGQIAMGMEPVIATDVAAAFNADMARCILRMHRSAVQPVMSDLGADLEAAAVRPGLVIMPSEDHNVGTTSNDGGRPPGPGAHVEILEGLGHFWMTQDDGRSGASALDAFWAAPLP